MAPLSQLKQCMILSVGLLGRILMLESGELVVVKWEHVSAALQTVYLGKLPSLRARGERESVIASLVRLGFRLKRLLEMFLGHL